MTMGRTRPLAEAAELLTGYLSFIRFHRGIAPATYKSHSTALSEFLEYLGAQGLSLSEVRVKDIDNFIMCVAGKARSKSYLYARINALRGFFRYLFGEGWLKHDISRFLETPRIYRESTVPPHFAWSELEHLLASIEGDSKVALRDRAMLALLCGYGLRGKEVASLTLDDVDWIHRLLRIQNRKGGSSIVLPLLPIVETALGEYIRKGRASSVPYREILLKSNGKPFKNGNSITNRLYRLMARAGFQKGRGCHAIRRAVGTRLIEQGWGLQEVALVLGHKSLDSARVYVRLSMELLRDVADNYGGIL